MPGEQLDDQNPEKKLAAFPKGGTVGTLIETLDKICANIPINDYGFISTIPQLEGWNVGYRDHNGQIKFGYVSGFWPSGNKIGVDENGVDIWDEASMLQVTYTESQWSGITDSLDAKQQIRWKPGEQEPFGSKPSTDSDQ